MSGFRARPVTARRLVCWGMEPPRITLIGKPGCHLCDDARAVVARVAEELGVGWTELDITEDEQLAEQYWEQIPVTLVDGRRHDYWRVDESRLRAALQ
jgi:glutaredoxin